MVHKVYVDISLWRELINTKHCQTEVICFTKEKIFRISLENTNDTILTY